MGLTGNTKGCPVTRLAKHLSCRSVTEPEQMQVCPFKPVVPLHANACHLAALYQAFDSVCFS